MKIDRIIVDHIEWINTKARQYCRDEKDAEDLAGETIYKCLRAKEYFDNSKAFKPWALAIMQNTFIKQYNRRKLCFFTELNPAEPMKGSDDTEQGAILSNIIAIIKSCHKKSCSIGCVTLYAMGYSYTEISEIKGLNIGTVKSRIAMGRKIIREQLK